MAFKSEPAPLLDELDVAIENAARVVANVSRDLDTYDWVDSRPARRRSSGEERTTVPARGRGNNRRSMLASTDIDREIEHLNRVCDDIERNLKSLNRETTNRTQTQVVESNSAADSTGALAMNRPGERSRSSSRAASSVPGPIIDLSDSFDNWEFRRVLNAPVVVTDVIDLCTPERQTGRRAGGGRGRVRGRGRGARSSLVSDTALGNDSDTVTMTAVVQPEPPKVEPSEQTSPTSNPTFMCAICMDSALTNRPTSTKCGHVFCETCIREAVRVTRKCPMCSTKLNSKSLCRLYIN